MIAREARGAAKISTAWPQGGAVVCMTETVCQTGGAATGGDAPGARTRPSVLMIGPGRNGRGGINAVITAYQNDRRWADYRCAWLETYDDRRRLAKCRAALSAWLRAPFLMRRADIVHIHGSFRTSFLRKLPLLCLARLMRKPVLFHVHAPSTELLTGPSGWIAKRIMPRLDRVVALSPSWVESLKSACNLENLVVVRNPILAQGIAPRTSCEPVLLFVGKLEERKGYLDLIRSFAEVLQAIPSATLVMAGHGDIEGARAVAKELGIQGSVSLPGWIDGSDKDAAFLAATHFCLPSYMEGVPIALLEAMSYGLPSVATRVGGVPDLIESGVNGVLVSAGSVPQLTAALIAVMSDRELATKLATNARRTVLRTYSVPAVWTELEALYGTVCGRGGPRDSPDRALQIPLKIAGPAVPTRADK